MLFLIGLSFSQNWVFPALLPERLSANSWSELITGNNGILQSAGLTLLIALSVALLATAGGFLTSQYIAYHKHRRRLLLLAYLPFLLSPVILAVCLKFYFIKLGIAGKASGVILAILIIAFPYSTIFFIGFWNKRLEDYTHLVRTLGGTSAVALQKIILPLAKPMLTVCFFQCFLIAWFEYGLTSVIGYGKVQTLTVKVYGYVTEANIFQAALCSCLLVLPPVLLLWVNKRIIFRETN
jgi:putative spermidine/putrescine transport system permease protein